MWFPNGMAVLGDDTLVVAESHTDRVTAWTITDSGGSRFDPDHRLHRSSSTPWSPTVTRSPPMPIAVLCRRSISLFPHHPDPAFLRVQRR